MREPCAYEGAPRRGATGSPLMPAQAACQFFAFTRISLWASRREGRARPSSSINIVSFTTSITMAPTLTGEAWAQIRYDYEHTERPIEDICAEHGISSGTLRDRMRRWGWTRRRPPIPRQGPPPLAGAARDAAGCARGAAACGHASVRRRGGAGSGQRFTPPRRLAQAGWRRLRRLACGARRRPSPDRACARARASAARVGG